MSLRPPAHRISPRTMLQWGLEYLLGALTLTGLASVAAAWGENGAWTWLPAALDARIWWLPVIIGTLGLLVTLTAPVWRYQVHRWEVSSDVVYTRIGWITRQWLLVPVSRIQTVDAEQGWIERLLGLATLKINTASHQGSSELTGLTAEQATLLAAELARRAHDLRDDAT
ncbi:MAG: PH domain-containing protein [Streptosporangiaceae bacterium]